MAEQRIKQRIVAGLSCSDVLARLSDYVDGDIEREVSQRVLDHLAGCNWCAEFGGRFSAVVAALREPREAAPLDEEVAERLKKHLFDGSDR